jgi:uncharacterized membrane protein YcaP (DUF421 family)
MLTTDMLYSGLRFGGIFQLVQVAIANLWHQHR